jgi:hypothetical protein
MKIGGWNASHDWSGSDDQPAYRYEIGEIPQIAKALYQRQEVVNGPMRSSPDHLQTQRQKGKVLDIVFS